MEELNAEARALEHDSSSSSSDSSDDEDDDPDKIVATKVKVNVYFIMKHLKYGQRLASLMNMP